jgi:hypothetical protein
MTKRIQLLDDLGAEFGRVAVEAERSPRKRFAFAGRRSGPGRRTRTAAIALGMVLLLVSGAYAMPATRTAVDGVTDSFVAWVSGDSKDAPGRALKPGDNVPSWFTAGGDARLIAEADGVGLYVRRADSDQGPWLEFGLGKGVGQSMGGPLEDWRQRLEQHEVVVLGATLYGPRDTLDDRGRSPLLGVTSRDVKRVELRYSDGQRLVGESGDGGFVLLVDAWRPLRELIGYDNTGRVLERVDMSSTDLTYLCKKDPGVCPQ